MGTVLLLPFLPFGEEWQYAFNELERDKVFESRPIYFDYIKIISS